MTTADEENEVQDNVVLLVTFNYQIEIQNCHLCCFTGIHVEGLSSVFSLP